MELQGVGFGGMEWTDLNQDGDRFWGLINAVMKFHVP